MFFFYFWNLTPLIFTSSLFRITQLHITWHFQETNNHIIWGLPVLLFSKHTEILQ